MTPQLVALQEIAEYLTANRIPYATIGGLAASVWGLPRATHDADVTVLVPFEKEEGFLWKWLREFDAALGHSEASNFFEKLFRQHTRSPDEPAH